MADEEETPAPTPPAEPKRSPLVARFLDRRAKAAAEKRAAEIEAEVLGDAPEETP